MTATVIPAAPAGSGFGPSFSRETHKWRSTSRWLKQTLLWTVLLGLLTFLFFALLAPVSGFINVLNLVYQFLQDGSVLTLVRALEGGGAESVQFSTASLVLPPMVAVGSTLIGQAVILLLAAQYFDEVRRGTLGWALGRPITRGAYLASKVLADGLGILLLTVLIPFGVLFAIMAATARSQDITLGNYVLGVLMVLLLLLFWHALVTMLTFVTRRRAVALAIPLLLLLLGNLVANSLDYLLGTVDLFRQIAPWSVRALIAPAMRGTLDLANSAQLVPLIAVLVWIVALYVIAWLALRRQDI
jgi:ABC-type transport system involved in multi-copper enzyme maturation permease subunit